MKRSTCKLLLGIAIGWYFLVFSFRYLSSLGDLSSASSLALWIWSIGFFLSLIIPLLTIISLFIKNKIFFYIITIIFAIFNIGLFTIPSLILTIIAITKWNSEKEFKSLKQRAKVHIHVKGKMKDLK